MGYSKRELLIIDILLRENTFISAHNLALQLETSTKTIYRTIKQINNESQNKNIILSEKGKGYRIEYDQYLKNAYIKENKVQTPIERRKYIILFLLFRSPNGVQYNYLYEKYFLSQEAINNDIYTMQTYLSGKNLELIRYNNRLKIIGKEKYIRGEINKIINDMEILNESSQLLKEGFSKRHDIEFIKEQVMYNIEIPLKKEIPYPYDVNIITHLTILINRFREGRVPSTAYEEINTEEKKTIEENSSLFFLAQQVIQNISSYLDVSLPKIEIYYLFQYLVSSGVSFIQDNNEKTLAESIATDYIEKVSQHYPRINRKTSLYLELFNHIRPMLYRINRQINISNGMLNEIKSEYHELYQYLSTITNEIEEKNEINTISEDEIGFIAIYFAKHLEINKYNKKIIIICSSGIGTSELLRVKVNNAFPDIEIVKVLPYRTFLKNLDKYQEIDLILTTVEFKVKVTSPYLLVNSMFTDRDKQMVKKIICEV